MSPTGKRRLRADAQRNRDRLLVEAAAVFAARGTDAPLEEIARRAKVAIGTLYSHFPTRAALLEALLEHEMVALRDRAIELADDPDPHGALLAWSRQAVVHTNHYRGLAASLKAAIDDEDSELHAACKSLIAAGDRLMDSARAAGVVRAEATAADLYTLINAIAWASEQLPPERGDRLLRFAVDGLREPATPDRT